MYTERKIANPILPGFNPDPSICRVGDDFYVATSTFEWYPGVQVHHSRDLANWRLLCRPLDRRELLDMRGDPDSCGVWAPCLTHDGERFWLVYTDVKSISGPYKDQHNYITSAESIEGPWADPVFANSSGFDPSLFHDGDGRSWLCNMVWDHRPGRNRFGGILLQEFDRKEGRLVGPVTNIFRGSKLGLTEAPHLYRRGGWYYLVTAEGGTSESHAMTMARSRELTGPYELHPDVHVLTSKDDHSLPLQRAGHADFVELEDGSVYVVHLTGRPLPGYFCVLGRETAIQRGRFADDGWLYLDGRDPAPKAEVPAPGLEECPWPERPQRRDFDSDKLPIEFQWLRTPEPDRLFSLTANPGSLTLFGRESPSSCFEHALVARRQEHFSFTAECSVEAKPEGYQQTAGLVCWYNSHKHHYLALSADEGGGRRLVVMSCPADWPGHALVMPETGTVEPPEGPVHMRAEVEGASLRFSWSADGKDWVRIGPALSQAQLSDEAGRGSGNSFTGAFVGMCAHDLTGRGMQAKFDYFSYSEN